MRPIHIGSIVAFIPFFRFFVRFSCMYIYKQVGEIKDIAIQIKYFLLLTMVIQKFINYQRAKLLTDKIIFHKGGKMSIFWWQIEFYLQISLIGTLWSLIFHPYETEFCVTEKWYAGIKKWVTPGSKSGYPNFLRIFSEEFWWISGK